MAINLNDNLKINAPKPTDARYFNGTQPWTDIPTFLANVPITERHIGLTVNIAGVEYSFTNWVADWDLIIKSVGNYLIVDTIEDRNNIAIELRKEWLLVFVTENQSSYRLENWIENINRALTDIVYNQSTTTETKSYYVDIVNWDDVSWDWTELTPRKTIEKCLRTIPSTIQHRTDIRLLPWVYTLSDEINLLLEKFRVDSWTFRFYWTLSPLLTWFTTSWWTNTPENPFEKTVVWATFWANEYFWKALMAWTSEDTVYWCGTHKENALTAWVLTSTTHITWIYEYQTKLILWNRFSCPYWWWTVQIKNMEIELLSSTTFAGNDITPRQFSWVKIMSWNNQINPTWNLDFWKALIIANKTTTTWWNAVISINDTDRTQKCSIKSSIIYNQSKSMYTIETMAKNILIDRTLIENFNRVFYMRNRSEITPNVQFPTSWENMMIFKNCNVLFHIIWNWHKLNRTVHNKIYLSNVTRIFELYTRARNNIIFDLRELFGAGSQMPTDWRFVWTEPAKLIDIEKMFIIMYPWSPRLPQTTTGVWVPSSTPTAIWDEYLDTNINTWYKAIWTTSSADRQLL